MVNEREGTDVDSGCIYMFAGKGGVGKTTCAATTALHHAQTGEETIAISTDATPSLAHIFETGDRQKPVKVQKQLYINEIGLDEVQQMWDNKFGKEVYEVFSTFVSIDYDSFLEFMTSMLPGLSDEFMVDYIREMKKGGRYQTIVWDTAPLGQTLALLHTPAMLVEHLRMAPRVYSRLKFGSKSQDSILNILRRWQKLSADSIDFLRQEVRFNIVTIAEALAFEQLEGIFKELDEHGFDVKQLIVNNVIKEYDSEFLMMKASQQRKYLSKIYERYSHLNIIEIPMCPYEIKGIERLKRIEQNLFY
ncbi:MAG: ArsA family ATPase [Dehalococcoidia bacterium]|nr:MAG: ArsA family ATPase [Dehalococcoidia bacterium]